MRARLLWWLDSLNHRLPGALCGLRRSLCDANEAAIWAGFPDEPMEDR